MKLYEGLFILPQTLYREDRQRALDIVKDIIEKFEGNISYLDLWDEKPLAYQIEHVRDVAYILCYFELDGALIQKIERAVILSEDILRCMLLTPDKSFDFEKFQIEAEEKATKTTSTPVEESEGAEAENAKAESAETESTETKVKEEDSASESQPAEEVNA